jgi:hypothetical protein
MNPMSTVAIALMEQMLQETERKLIEACEEIIALKNANEDLNTVAKFWRQAAEHACVGWNALEDEHEVLKETLRALGANDSPSEPERVEESLVDLGDGLKLTVVETETPYVKR